MNTVMTKLINKAKFILLKILIYKIIQINLLIRI